MTSVVIPCFNEEHRIGPTLQKMVAFLSGRDQPWEVIVVDDGSADGTSDVVRHAFSGEARVRVIRHETNSGKGFAVCAGALAATGDLVLMSDADLSTPIAEVVGLEAKAAEGFDLVVGSRVMPGAHISAAQPLRRRLSGWVFRRLVRVLGLCSVEDTQCGFKLMRRPAIDGVLRRIETEGFAFDVELIARAERAGLRVAEVPITWHDAEGSKVRLFPDALRMAADLVKLRRRVAR
jgi:dolichyl-phosphate beta-glucosyltransferase